VKYLPDTNTLIAVMRNKQSVVDRFRFLRAEDVGISMIVYHELVYGAVNSDRRQESFASIESFRFELLPFEAEDAFRAAEIRASLKARGTPIGAYDVLIAGQALARDLTVVTRNTREFLRVEGLKLEDWED
jgi:tRNA(fMet)-specific endonuclease VapC